METAVLIAELIVFILMAIFFTYNLIVIVKDRIYAKKAQMNFDKTLGDIANAFIEKIKEADVEVKDNKKTNDKKDYADMSVSELKKVAQKKKIKGYYNLKKDELVKTLKETEILPE